MELSFKRVIPAKWISLPYAHPDVLRAFVTNESYRPAPCHDLFMFAASLHRLLVPWAPCCEVNTTVDAENLARYWELIMSPAIPIEASADADLGGDEDTSFASSSVDASAVAGYKKRRLDAPAVQAAASAAPQAADDTGSVSEDSSTHLSSPARLGTVSPWGVLFNAAAAYDLVAFEASAGNAVRSVVPDWPW